MYSHFFSQLVKYKSLLRPSVDVGVAAPFEFRRVKYTPFHKALLAFGVLKLLWCMYNRYKNAI
jgi:hypothetical protein